MSCHVILAKALQLSISNLHKTFGIPNITLEIDREQNIIDLTMISIQIFIFNYVLSTTTIFSGIVKHFIPWQYGWRL